MSPQTGLHKPRRKFYYFVRYNRPLSFLHSIPASSEPVSDQQLVARFKATGDLTILADLYQRYMDLLYGVCLKYLKDPPLAQDAVMGIYETLIVQLPRHEVSFFRAWVYQVTRNYCLMQLRKKAADLKFPPFPIWNWQKTGIRGKPRKRSSG